MSRSIEMIFRKYALAAFAIFSVIAIALACSPVNAQSDDKVTPVKITEQPQGKSFATPEAAAANLYAAACRNDEHDLMVILGPDAKDIIMWTDDADARKERREEFMREYDRMHRLVKEPDNTVALYVGADNWPIPIPLVQYKGAWYFDAMLGKQEIMYRRIGRNEIEALQVSNALVDAEKDYFANAKEYTTKFSSTAGAHDGLYWGGNDGAPKSPIGPYLAHAGMDASGSADSGTPYHGYYYRILSLQGPGASGGSRSYVDNGKMTGGFAIVALPAVYRISGVMTFMMDQNGDAYEKDLGPSTDRAAKEISSFNPDSSWEKVQ